MSQLSHADKKHLSIMPYVVGFGLSIIFTLAAFWTVTEGWMDNRGSTIWLLMILATVQLVIQMVFFLHIGKEEKGKRWNLMSFWLMLFFVLVLSIGSIWVMHNLDYNMMSPELMDEHMLIERDKGF